MTPADRHGDTILDVAPWVAKSLACPRDRQPVHVEGSELACPNRHRYPVVDGIPVMLLPEVEQTHWAAARTLDESSRALGGEPRPEAPLTSHEIDPFVQEAIGATNGYMYRPLIGRLTRYPIPELRAPRRAGDRFLDIGCGWGRWCVAAARAGYHPVGIDPSLTAIRAARRVARQLGSCGSYLVADARYLPFGDQTVDAVFSYSVLQHFDKDDARLAFREMGRVLRFGGRGNVQMANAFGLRSIYHQARRGLRAPRRFEVRYWSVPELRSMVQDLIGSVELSADGFFTLNPQPSDMELIPRRYRLVVRASEILRKASQKFSALVYVADSVNVTWRRPK